MGKKVKIAVFDKDQTVKLEKHELSKSGNKIDIVSGGEGYFMPEIGPTKFLYWPIRKRFLFFGAWVYERIYFALKRGASCVDFARKITIFDEETNIGAIVYGPDEEQVKQANTNLIATRIGVDTIQKTPWYIWAILASVMLNLLLMLNMSGVLR
jgi:hypothetical protein